MIIFDCLSQDVESNQSSTNDLFLENFYCFKSILFLREYFIHITFAILWGTSGGVVVSKLD